MEDEFAEMEVEFSTEGEGTTRESRYVPGRTQGVEVGPINFTRLVRSPGSVLTLPREGDVTLTFFPPQYDSETGTYRSGTVRSVVTREDLEEPFTSMVPLELDPDVLSELAGQLGMEDTDFDDPRGRLDVEISALEQGIPVSMNMLSVTPLNQALLVTGSLVREVQSFMESLTGDFPIFRSTLERQGF